MRPPSRTTWRGAWPAPPPAPGHPGAGLFARAAKSEFPRGPFRPTDGRGRRPGYRWRTAPAAAARGCGGRSRPGCWPWFPERCSRSTPVGAVRAREARADAAATRLADAEGLAGRRSRAAAGDAEARYAAAKQQARRVLAEWVAAEKAADRAEKDRPVAVTKPVAVQPGCARTTSSSPPGPGGRPPRQAGRGRGPRPAGAVLYTQRLDSQKPADTHRSASRPGPGRRSTRGPELFLAVAAVDEDRHPHRPAHDPIRLFGPVYTTMLVTDKASYRPGERLFFRSLTLDRVTFRPPAREQVLHYVLRRADGTPVPGATYGTTGAVRIADGRVEPVPGPDGSPLRGVGCGRVRTPGRPDRWRLRPDPRPNCPAAAAARPPLRSRSRGR